MEHVPQTVRKCIHQKFLPIGQHPAQAGILESSCGHITPVYNFGWCISMEDFDQYYPECPSDLTSYWIKHVTEPWAKEFPNKYLSKQPGFGYSPRLDFIFINKEPYLVVILTRNSTKESLALSRNEDYIADARRLARIQEIFGELRWIRA
ncbi:hypothetical protein C8R41DRAFT_926975 [Lentinula lateritia]|uniref:Uncharacterized protein n=1 Tax=Lentinula lateritia TaxID=40482 RepID=A0ABQ8UYM9_9AGAR|nr:hypothetical protein C8R41DRAFT_926975 [Lentinula lateritia]